MSTSMQLNLPPNLLQSICYVESTHRINSVHYNDGTSNSIGICQIKLRTAQWLGFKGTERELMEPNVNIYYAGLYLRHQLTRYKVVNKAVIAYNQGHAGLLTSSKYQIKVYKQWRIADNER